MKKNKKIAWKKRRAIYLLAACQMDEETVAQDLGLKRATIMRWLRDPDFVNRLEGHLDSIEYHDSEWRAKQARQASGALYAELHRRVSDPKELRDIPLSTLVKTLKDVNFEARIDGGESTSRSEEVFSLENLKERYEKSISSGYNVRDLKLIEGPVTETVKKETENGKEIYVEEN